MRQSKRACENNASASDQVYCHLVHEVSGSNSSTEKTHCRWFESSLHVGRYSAFVSPGSVEASVRTYEIHDEASKETIIHSISNFYCQHADDVIQMLSETDKDQNATEKGKRMPSCSA